MNKQRASREGYDQGDDEIPSLDDFLHQVIIITSEVPIEKNDFTDDYKILTKWSKKIQKIESRLDTPLR